jgi:hypothetical protein
MKKGIQTTLGLCAVALLATGCTSGMSKMAKALANDKATVTGSVTSIYGTMKFVRTNPQGTNQSVTVSPDGTVTITAPK